MSIRHFLSTDAFEFVFVFVFSGPLSDAGCDVSQACMKDALLLVAVAFVGALGEAAMRRFGARCSYPSGLLRSFIMVFHKSSSTFIAC